MLLSALYSVLVLCDSLHPLTQIKTKSEYPTTSCMWRVSDRQYLHSELAEGLKKVRGACATNVANVTELWRSETSLGLM